jgi:hypothetical protein
MERACEQGGRGRRRLPGLLRGRRRRDRWTDEVRRLYQRHRWRSEGYHGEAKSWHRLHCADGGRFTDVVNIRFLACAGSSGTEALPVATYSPHAGG